MITGQETKNGRGKHVILVLKINQFSGTGEEWNSGPGKHVIPVLRPEDQNPKSGQGKHVILVFSFEIINNIVLTF